MEYILCIFCAVLVFIFCYFFISRDTRDSGKNKVGNNSMKYDKMTKKN